MGKILHPHHRRPSSLGGTNSPSNKSYVDNALHSSWHNIFGNMNAYQIANHINFLDIPYKPQNIYVVCKFINGEEVAKTGSSNKNFTKNEAKMMESWYKLFSKIKSFEEIVAYINNVWLDPSYHLYIRKLD